MAAFVAAASSMGRTMSPPSPSLSLSLSSPLSASSSASSSSAMPELSSLAVLEGRQFQQLNMGACRGGWGQCGNPRSRCLKIVARSGGYRPPPGARRPRPSGNRQQQSEDDSSRDRIPVNEEITASTVMLIGEDGKLMGTFSRYEALEKARAEELDLVQMDNQNPPCVKLLDYSKFKYEIQKRKREQQKKSIANRMDLKELKMRYNIDTHDYGVRLKSAQRFLRDGDKVKLIVQFKGREMEFKDLALKLFERFEEDLAEEAVVESKLTRDGRNMSMVFAPSKLKVPGQVPSSEKTKDDEDVGAVAVGAEA